MKKAGMRMAVWVLLASLLMFPVPAGAESAALCQVNAIEASNAGWKACNAQTGLGLEIVRQANRRIEQIIVESCSMAERAGCDLEIQAIILSLRMRTRIVSETAQAAASLCGVKTVCEYVSVEIGGYTVWVDPIRVVLV